MQERREDYPQIKEDIKKIKEDVDGIKHILNGNGKKGVVARVIDCEDYINKEIGKRDSIWMALFRASLGLAVAYICYKVGLK